MSQKKVKVELKIELETIWEQDEDQTIDELKEQVYEHWSDLELCDASIIDDYMTVTEVEQ